MTSRAENELLTRVGPGTPMGALMRQYWLPACLSSELAADGDPLRLMLLGEKLDRVSRQRGTGRRPRSPLPAPLRLAVLRPQRGRRAALRLSRLEVRHRRQLPRHAERAGRPGLPAQGQGQGLPRWPSAAASSRSTWAARGAAAAAGARGDAVPALTRPTSLRPQRECNWLQALEGDIDTSHFSFLHTGKVDARRHRSRSSGAVPADRSRAALPRRGRPIGARCTRAYRPAEPGHLYYRFAHFAFPFWTLFPNGPLTDNILRRRGSRWTTPTRWHSPLAGSAKPRCSASPGRASRCRFSTAVTATLPNTADWFGRWRPVANQDNDYLIDREAQRTISYTGIAGVFPQDSAVTESMGDIADRTLEHLAPSDRMIVMTRRRLLDAARALRDKGLSRRSSTIPRSSAARRSGDLIAPEGQPWLEAYEETLHQALHPVMLQASE